MNSKQMSIEYGAQDKRPGPKIQAWEMQHVGGG